MESNAILANTSRVTIELSNICNLSHQHKLCPASLVKKGEKTILASTIVYHILYTCKEIGFTGRLAFHRYNEPTCDPRLMEFIDYAQQGCCGEVFIMTNGVYWTPSLEKEFRRRNVTLEIHDYSITKLNPIVLKIYDEPLIPCTKPCYAPLNDLTINCQGEIALCCRDWKNAHTFGSLYKHTLSELLMSPPVQECYAKLIKGERFLDLCTRCNLER